MFTKGCILFRSWRLERLGVYTLVETKLLTFLLITPELKKIKKSGTRFHISPVNVQTNYCNNNLLILDVKQLNNLHNNLNFAFTFLICIENFRY